MQMTRRARSANVIMWDNRAHEEKLEELNS